MLQSHKPFESGTADWLMESMERLRLAMGEFLAMWGGIEKMKRQMKEIRQEVQKWLAFVAANRSGITERIFQIRSVSARVCTPV